MNNKVIKLVLNSILVLIAVVLGFFLFTTINEPIEFRKLSKKRMDAAKFRLETIRDAQLAYRDLHGSFAPDFETLVAALKNEQFPVVKVVGDEDLLDVDTSAVVIYDTSYIPLLEQAFKDRDNYDYLDSLQYVPYSNGEKKFELQVGEVEVSQITVPTFQVSVSEKDLFDGLNKEFIDPEKNIQLGKLYEVNYNGNW